MSDRTPGEDRISPRFWIGLAIVVVIVLFIALNRDDATVSFLLFDAQTSLWVALTIAGGLGFIAGWLIGRRRR